MPQPTFSGCTLAPEIHSSTPPSPLSSVHVAVTCFPLVRVINATVYCFSKFHFLRSLENDLVQSQGLALLWLVGAQTSSALFTA